MPPADASGQETLTPGDVARILHVSARTVRRWGDEGRLPYLTTLGGHRRFRRADVERIVRPATMKTPALSEESPVLSEEAWDAIERRINRVLELKVGDLDRLTAMEREQSDSTRQA